MLVLRLFFLVFVSVADTPVVAIRGYMIPSKHVKPVLWKPAYAQRMHEFRCHQMMSSSGALAGFINFAPPNKVNVVLADRSAGGTVV